MTRAAYEALILEGLRGLPADALAEITDYVYFVRKRCLHPAAFAAELEALRLNGETSELSRHETAHLEEEFANFDERFPRQ
jgi:hypothetical protein